MRDGWGWELIGQADLQTLVRVDASKAGFWIKSSGMIVGDSRWFLEPIQWQAPLEPAVAPMVEWIGLENLTAAAKVAVDKAKLYGLGVILGRRQVGVRVPRGKQPAPDDKRRCLWKFLNVPFDMIGEDVVNLATKAGFQDIEINAFVQTPYRTLISK